MATKAEMDKVLTNVSILYKNQGYVGQALFPILPVKQMGGKYKVYNKPDRFTLPNTLVGPKGNVPEVGYEVSEQSFTCRDHALMDFVPNSEIAMSADPLDPKLDATEALTELIRLDYEKAVKAAITALPSGQKTTVSKKWSAADSDPVKDVMTARQSMWKKPNLLVLSPDAYNALLCNPSVLDRIKYTSAELAMNILARLFEVETLLVADAKENTAGTVKDTAVLSPVWSKEAVLAYVNPRPSLRTVTLGATITPFPNFWQVYSWEDGTRGGQGGQMVKVAGCYDIVTMCTDCAFALNGVLA